MTAAALQLVPAIAPAAPPVEPPTDIAVYKIMGGRISRGTVNSKLPSVVVDKSVFMSAPILPYANETLAAVRAISDRCVPWVQVFCGPELWAYDWPGGRPDSFFEPKHGRRPRHASTRRASLGPQRRAGS